MARTIYSGTYVNGIVLSNPATQDPATITATGTVSDTVTALFGKAGTAWTVSNFGTIEGTGPASGGIYLAAGGRVTNNAGGFISGAVDAVCIANATGAVVNSGTIEGTGVGSGGIYLTAGGSVTNRSGGLITENIRGITVGHLPGDVRNLGTITGTGTSGEGIFLTSGGSVANGASGSTAASIEGAATAIIIGGTAGGVGTVANFGEIKAISGAGVVLLAGGSVSNDGTIKTIGGDSVVLASGGRLSNLGTIDNSGTANFGVLAAKGAVINGSSASTKALIEGVGGVFLSGTATTGALTNYGTIKATTEPAVILDGGGTVSNFGTIESARLDAGIRGATGTISNFGTVISTNTTNGGAVWLAKGGVVTNGSSGSTAALITSERFAIYIGGNLGTHYAGAVGTVTNFGTVETTGMQSAVLLVAGGAVRNFGAIEGYRGVHFESAAGIVANSGTIKGTKANAIALDAGGTVCNLGTIESSAGDGVFLAGGRVNNGAVSKPTALIAGDRHGIDIRNAGIVANFGTVESAASGNTVGILTYDARGAVANWGKIAGGASGHGVYFDNGGLVTNASASAVIRGGNGVTSSDFGGTATVSNSGVILGTGFAGVWIEDGGTIANLGTIESTGAGRYGIDFLKGGKAVNGSAGNTAALIKGGIEGVVVEGAAATIANFGTIEGIGNASSVLTLGVALAAGGTVANHGIIAGGSYGIAFGTTASAGTIVNSGTIRGKLGLGIVVGNTAGNALINSGRVVGTGGIAVAFGGGNDVLTVEQGAVFVGAVQGGKGTDKVIEGAHGALNVTGFSGFETIVLANGGADSLTLSNANFAGVAGSSIAIDGGNNGNTVNAAGLGGANRIVAVGGAGKDVFTGGAGNDVFYFAQANLAATDIVKGGDGSDTLVVTTPGIVHAAGVSGVETYRLGNGGPDTLSLTNNNFFGVSGLSVSPGAVPTIAVFDGNSGNSVSATGVAASDRIVFHAGGGIDHLIGGAGGDVFYTDGKTTMTGGAGANKFVFAGSGTNKITDFALSTNNDLVFSDSGFDLGLGGGSATPRELTNPQATELFVANTTGKFANASQRLAYDESTGQLFAGAQGSAGSEQLVATLTDHAAIALTQLFYIA